MLKKFGLKLNKYDMLFRKGFVWNGSVRKGVFYFKRFDQFEFFSKRAGVQPGTIEKNIWFENIWFRFEKNRFSSKMFHSKRVKKGSDLKRIGTVKKCLTQIG